MQWGLGSCMRIRPNSATADSPTEKLGDKKTRRQDHSPTKEGVTNFTDSEMRGPHAGRRLGEVRSCWTCMNINVKFSAEKRRRLTKSHMKYRTQIIIEKPQGIGEHLRELVLVIFRGRKRQIYRKHWAIEVMVVRMREGFGRVFD